MGFGALAVAAAMNWAPMWFAIPVCVIAAFLLLRLSESARIKGDAAIAMVSSGACLATGVMVISRSTGMSTDVYNYMFGSILSLSADDAILSGVLSVCVLVLFILFYPRIFAITFDETFSQANRHARRALQFRACSAYSRNCRYRHAHDGCHAHIEPYNISCPYIHARMQAL